MLACPVLFAAFLVCCSIEAGEFVLSPTLSFDGAEDGSAAADVGDGFFVGATDEENVLRLYDSNGRVQSNAASVDVDSAVKSALGVQKIKECDFEGAARIGDLIFWVGSHGRNKDANEKKERQVLVATKVRGAGKDAKLEIEGKVYTKLLGDLIKHPALSRFDLGKAAELAPKEEGALNIESLTADGGRLWLGFRNPQVNEREALLVPLLNPMEMIDKGDPAQIGEPETLQIGGLGIRDMVVWSDRFLIIAGDFADRSRADAKPSRLFSWKPGTNPQDLEIDFGDLNPEAIVVISEGDKSRVLILSDDGEPATAFRGAWLQPIAP